MQSFSSTAGWRYSRAAAAAIGLLLFSPSAPSESLAESAIKFFLGNDSNTPGFDLDKSRPQPVSSDFKAAVLSSLPREGRITKLNGLQLQKLDSLSAVLQLHQRQSVYELRVFKTDQPLAFVGLHKRAVLLISRAALNLLDAWELQASVAHEIGHEYVWAENLEATKRHDNRRLKELELICDGVAILTLRRVGLDAAPLLAAAEKITNFNSLSAGPPESVERYPTADERRRFARALGTWADNHGYPGQRCKMTPWASDTSLSSAFQWELSLIRNWPDAWASSMSKVRRQDET